MKASDVTLIDKDTKEDLSAYLKADEKGYVSLKAISAQDAGETPLRLNLIEGQPESGSKNYSIAASTDKKQMQMDIEQSKHLIKQLLLFVIYLQ